MEGFQDLGQRIVQVARMAVAAHLYESVAERTTPEGPEMRAARQILRHRDDGTGGAGLHDEPGDDENGAVPPVTPRLGYLVTDDERDGLMGFERPVDETIDGHDDSGR